jgi:hypothetical protein
MLYNKKLITLLLQKDVRGQGLCQPSGLLHFPAVFHNEGHPAAVPLPVKTLPNLRFGHVLEGPAEVIFCTSLTGV